MSDFVHMELNTGDPAAARKFYKSMFGWKFTSWKMPDGSAYLGFTAPSGPGGGIQKHPMPGAPPAWLPYVGVASVKRAMAKAKKLGAQPVVEYMEVATMGALGIFVDPTGATFAVWQTFPKPLAEVPAEAATAKPAADKAPAKKATPKKAPAKKAAPKKAPAKKAAPKKG